MKNIPSGNPIISSGVAERVPSDLLDPRVDCGDPGVDPGVSAVRRAINSPRHHADQGVMPRLKGR